MEVGLVRWVWHRHDKGGDNRFLELRVELLFALVLGKSIVGDIGSSKVPTSEDELVEGVSKCPLRLPCLEPVVCVREVCLVEFSVEGICLWS